MTGAFRGHSLMPQSESWLGSARQTVEQRAETSVAAQKLVYDSIAQRVRTSRTLSHGAKGFSEAGLTQDIQAVQRVELENPGYGNLSRLLRVLCSAGRRCHPSPTHCGNCPPQP